jgi:hypothetical protein
MTNHSQRQIMALAVTEISIIADVHDCSLSDESERRSPNVSCLPILGRCRHESFMRLFEASVVCGEIDPLANPLL